MKHWIIMNMLLLVGSIFAFSQPYDSWQNVAYNQPPHASYQP